MSITKIGRVLGENFHQAQLDASFMPPGQNELVLNRSASDKVSEDPTTWRKALAYGAGIGGGLGSLIGAGSSPKNRALGVLGGLAAGAGVGSLTGAAAKVKDDNQMKDAKRYIEESPAIKARRQANFQRLREVRNNEDLADRLDLNSRLRER
jgi:hypothetical protein